MIAENMFYLTLVYCRESDTNDYIHYRESFMEVMDEIEDWLYEQ